MGSMNKWLGFSLSSQSQPPLALPLPFLSHSQGISDPTTVDDGDVSGNIAEFKPLLPLLLLVPVPEHDTCIL